ncbi:ArsR/SmtB family transcription factor [Vibrio superstes]|uniref:HTH arsR-type domain-containing protein n=1 Tax=Vibrio superstes NBRC 103154 TaxID=1219062 RepID=A0A511QR61_9VIBR|nr:helix-turn-helix domain-containing protein [Vibrio superstes]GEM79811.1 hypothetical protein VSU01S_20560 [Vibrio superstes NBRC 103154]
MQLEDAAKVLKELGHPTRLCIYKEVVKYGATGIPVGALQSMLCVPNSTLSHHITSLVSVGLISQKREGRILRCISEYGLLEEVLTFIKDECCLTREG